MRCARSSRCGRAWLRQYAQRAPASVSRVAPAAPSASCPSVPCVTAKMPVASSPNVPTSRSTWPLRVAAPSGKVLSSAVRHSACCSAAVGLLTSSATVGRCQLCRRSRLPTRSTLPAAASRKAASAASRPPSGCSPSSISTRSTRPASSHSRAQSCARCAASAGRYGIARGGQYKEMQTQPAHAASATARRTSRPAPKRCTAASGRCPRPPARLPRSQPPVRVLRRRQEGEIACWLHYPRQPGIQVIDAGQIMEDPLVDAQGAACQAAPRLDVNQLPAAQRGFGRQSRPMRLWQHSQGQGKGRISPAGIALRCRTQRHKGGVEFDAGTKQQQVTLKRRKAETLAHQVQGGRLCMGHGRCRPRGRVRRK